MANCIDLNDLRRSIEVFFATREVKVARRENSQLVDCEWTCDSMAYHQFAGLLRDVADNACRPYSLTWDNESIQGVTSSRCRCTFGFDGL